MSLAVSRAPVREGDILAGKYVVERVLGVGGMGVVVAARHQLLGGRVALKFVLPELATTQQIVQRFIKEAQSATLITSEHVARVTDVGTLDEQIPYMVMEYLEGRDLGGLLAERGPLPVPEAVDYLLQGLQAVAEAHAKGIVHRDLKPSNLFLTRRADGTPLVKVLDFGIAKAVLPDAMGGSGNDLTGTHGTVGSPLYMSPEQIKSSKSVDPRTDVWAAGVILHELLTRGYPFMADSAGALLAHILTEAPVPVRAQRPDVPEGVERAILGCLEKDVTRRIASVHVLAELLAPFGTSDARLSSSRIAGISGASKGGVTAPIPLVTPASTGVPNATGSAWGGTHADAATGPSARTTRPVPAIALALAGLVALGALGGGLWLFTRHDAPARTEPAAPAAAQPAAPTPVQAAALAATQVPAPAPPPVETTAPAALPATSAAPSPPEPATAAVVKSPAAPVPRAPAAARPAPRPSKAATSAPTSPPPAAAPAPAPKPRAKGALDGLIDQR